MSFFAFSLACLPAIAQEADSTVILRSASMLDELYPTYQLSPGNWFKVHFDSTYFIRTDSKQKLQVIDSSYYWRNIMNAGFNNGNHYSEKADTVINVYHLSWNAQGRINYLNFEQGQFYEEVQYGYRNGKIVVSEIHRLPERVDSVHLTWNRSGQLNRESYVQYQHNRKMDSTSTMEKLYDSKGRVIVITNYLFGHVIKGTMVYDYQDNGKLQARRFLLRAGGPTFFVDTLIYSFADSAKTLLRTQHKLKITGNEKWIDIDEKTEIIASGLMIEYKPLHAQSNITSRFGHLGTDYLQWHYNLADKVDVEMRFDEKGREVERTNYYYNDEGLCDSSFTVNSEYYEEKVEVRRSRTITTYLPHTKLIDTITTVEYSIEENKKKKSWAKSQVSVIHFKWT